MALHYVLMMLLSNKCLGHFQYLSARSEDVTYKIASSAMSMQKWEMVLLPRKTSSISRTKFQNLNVSCILLQLSLLNSLKPGVKLQMKM